MSDLFDNSDDLDDETSQINIDESDASGKEHSGAALAHLALSAALNRKGRALLKRHPNLSILHVPDREWIPVIAAAIKSLDKAPAVQRAAERFKQSGVLERVGQDELAYLRTGRSVLYISQDPDEILHDAVLAAADIRITLEPMTAALLRSLIHRITNGIARGITEEMAGLPLSVILGIVRRERTARQCVQGLKRALKRKPRPKPPSVPLLMDLPLTNSVRRWTTEVLADLKAVEAGNLEASDLVFGLLEGPPGTGKTLIAESLAHTAEWNFISTSIGAWFASGDGALGGVAKNLRSFIDDIIAHEPAIGFLDELDALPNRATMDNRARDWWTPVITLFLTEIDRLRASGKRVLLLGATNFYERLDGALIRPGRLQQRISVLPPQTQDEVDAVFRHYLGAELIPAEILKLAGIGKGATPAAIEGWIKQGRNLARSIGRPLSAKDILQQMLPPDDRNQTDIQAIAIHELGHAFVAHRLGHVVERVSIVAEGSSGGHTRMRMPSQVPTWPSQLDLVAINLGGRAADMLIGNGANAGAERDLATATDLLIAAHNRQGLRENLVYLPQAEVDPTSHETLNAELHRQLKRALELVEADREILLKLAMRLAEEKVLTGDDVAQALESTSPTLKRQEPQRKMDRKAARHSGGVINS